MSNVRLAEIQNLHWRQRQQLAVSLGLEKPENVSWDDFSETILQAELAKGDSAVKTVDEIETYDQSANLDYHFDQNGKCPVCLAKARTHDDGQYFCPVENQHCPRN